MLTALKLAILTVFIWNYKCVPPHPAHSVPYQVFVVYKAAYQVYKVGHYKIHFLGLLSELKQYKS